MISPTLTRAARAILKRLGYSLVRVEDIGWEPENLRKSGLSPRVVFDVGVGEGTAPLYLAFPEAYFVLVDPLVESRELIAPRLRHSRGEFALAAAGAKDGTATLYAEPEALGRSSLLRRTALTSGDSLLDPRKVAMRSLDSLAAERDLVGPFGVKIDTEGFELEVLLGATRLLRTTQFVIAETSLAKRFEGSYEPAELVTFMSERGFRLSDILHVSRRRHTREALFADLMFVARDLSG